MATHKMSVKFWYWSTSRCGNNKLTRQEWIAWWEATGKFNQRGPCIGQYFMSRIDKSLPFMLGNIELKQHLPGKRNKRDYGHIFQ